MEELEIDGEFWWEDKPDRRVAGRLTSNATDGPVLDLIGSLHDPDDVLARQPGPNISLPIEELLGANRGPIRIHGQTPRGPVTLLDCTRLRGDFPLFGCGAKKNARESYRVWLILSGAHMSQQDSTQIRAMCCQFSNLERWVGRTGISIKPPLGIRSSPSEHITITHTPVDTVIAPSPRGDVELSFPVKPSIDAFEVGVTQGCSIGIRFSQPLTLEDALEFSADLQDLVSVGVDSLAPITEMSVSYSEPTDTGLSTDDADREIRAYGRWRGGTNRRTPKRVHPVEMLFTFDGIGGMDGIGRWLEVSDEYRLAIGPLMRPVYSPGMYADIRFEQTVIGAEALGRIRVNDPNVILKDVLVGIAADAGDMAKSLVGDDIDAWAKEVKDTRVENIVHRGLHGSAEAQRLYWLSESLYLLVVISLLRECGVSEDTLSRMQEHQRFMETARGLVETKPRARPTAKKSASSKRSGRGGRSGRRSGGRRRAR